MRTYATPEWKGRCFCWFPAAILVDSFCPPIWRLHTKLYKGAWNVSATNSETVGHKDLRFGQIVYILVFYYNISFSCLLPRDGFRFIFLCRVYCVTVKTKNSSEFCHWYYVFHQPLYACCLRCWRFRCEKIPLNQITLLTSCFSKRSHDITL